jgi:Secretion system C-terminal sorting domain/NHL repeat
MKRILSVLLCLPFLSNGQIINTIAGNGSTGYSGDGLAATAAAISDPGGLAFDHFGNIYIGGYYNNTIRKVSPAGIITTIAGNGTGGFSGDGGPSTAALLSYPTKIALDPSGNLYIADQLNNRIRKISTTGIISTVAGNGSVGFGSDGVAATSTSVFHPTGVCLDASGNIYIADCANNRIRKVSTSGIISTVAGNGFTGSGGDGGMATAAQLYQPFGVTVDATGIIYIADQQNNKIRKVSTSGIITTSAGTGVSGFSGDGGMASAAQLSTPGAIILDNAGNFYIADQSNHRIRKVTSTGVISTIAGIGSPGFSGDGGPAIAAEFNALNEIQFDTSWRLVICDNTNHRVRRIGTCPNYITTQPVHDTVPELTNATYTVITTMPSPVYQWQEDPGTGFVNLANVWPYSGVTTNTLTIHNTSMYLNTTHYRCYISNGSSCTDTSSSAILIVRSTTGTLHLSAETVNIYPNPAHDKLVITMPEQVRHGHIQLINAIGQIVSKRDIENGSGTLDIAELPAGIYIAKITADGQVVYKKISKN